MLQKLLHVISEPANLWMGSKVSRRRSCDSIRSTRPSGVHSLTILEWHFYNLRSIKLKKTLHREGLEGPNKRDKWKSRDRHPLGHPMFHDFSWSSNSFFFAFYDFMLISLLIKQRNCRKAKDILTFGGFVKTKWLLQKLKLVFHVQKDNALNIQISL